MKKFLPHICFLSTLIIIVVVAYLGNIAVIGAFTGSITGMITDPLLLIGSIAIGAYIIKQRYLVLFSIAFAIVFSLYIQFLHPQNNIDLLMIMFISRTITVLIIAYIANIFRFLISPNK